MDPKLRSECIALIDRYLLRFPITNKNDFELAWQALQSTISSEKQYVVHPKFSHHIVGLYDFFNMPEIYVPEEDHEEFKQILRERIALKISHLQNCDEEEKISYMNNYNKDKMLAEEYQKISEKSLPPALGSEAHTLPEQEWPQHMQDEETSLDEDSINILGEIFTIEEWLSIAETKRRIMLNNAIKIQCLVNECNADPFDLLTIDTNLLQEVCYRCRAIQKLTQDTYLTFNYIKLLDPPLRTLLLKYAYQFVYLINNIEELNAYTLLTLPYSIQKDLLTHRKLIYELVNDREIPFNKLIGLEPTVLHHFLTEMNSDQSEKILHWLIKPDTDEPIPTKKIKMD